MRYNIPNDQTSAGLLNFRLVRTSGALQRTYIRIKVKQWERVRPEIYRKFRFGGGTIVIIFLVETF